MQETQKTLKRLGLSIAKSVNAMGFTKKGKKMSYRQSLDVVAKIGGMKAWQAVAAMKPVNAEEGVLKMDPMYSDSGDIQHDGTDYVLAPDASSCWITVDGFAVHVLRTAEGVIVDVHAHRSFADSSIASTYAFNTDAEHDLCESRGVEIDQVAEWVGLHYKVNFDAESGPKRHEWILRYLESHVEEHKGKVEEPKDRYVNRILDLYISGQDNAYEAFIRVYGATHDPEGQDDISYIKRCAEQDFFDGDAGAAVYQNIYDEIVRENIASPRLSSPKDDKFAEELLAIAGASVIEDPDQPGMNYGWEGSGESFGTRQEAQEALTREVVGFVMGYADLSSEFWDSLSYIQKLDVARGVYKAEKTECSQCGLPTSVDSDGLCNRCSQDSDNHTAEILQHRISWFLRGEGAPAVLDECSVEHIEKCIKELYNQGELCVLGSDGATEYRGWWSIKKD